VIAAACREHAHFHALDTAAYHTHLQAKARGVAFAAQHARGDWLFITDADGVVHPMWLRTMLGRADERTGILSGLFVAEPNSIVGVLERGTGLAALSISFGVEGLGAEVVPMGPNMAIRRSIYEAHGGLESVSFRIAEDIALWQLNQRAGMQVRAVLEPEATIAVQPVPSLRHLVSQQRRWLVGGFGDGPPHIRFASVSVSIFALFATLSTLLLLVLDAKVGMIGVGLCLVSQLASISGLRKRLGLRSVFRIVPIGFVYAMALFVWLPLSAFLLPVVYWRGEGYDVRFASERVPGAS
jgi:cellulose synthase/poly-beta-1,6-N-acetylglucosamine synthase-like glycosyltransferase